MRTASCISVFAICLLSCSLLQAQRDSTYCTVRWKDLQTWYTGDCKLGMAEGSGEAKGVHHYKGSFKDGMPDGEGVYDYSDSVFYTGHLQDGIREGKGEMHYLHRNFPDSIVKGFWSADEFRGKKYTTYTFNSSTTFDNLEIKPSSGSGNTITFEISTTSGSPNGAPSGTGNSGFVLSLKDIISPSSSIVKTISKFESARKSYITYELSGFPCSLSGVLSDNSTFNLELFKSANWKVRFFVNK
jgi:hypothetical protein